MALSDQVPAPIRGIIAKLKSSGFEAYLVGGAVRDLMLGRPPKDHDIATDATPRQIKRLFGRKARIIGRRFRLAHVYTARGPVEVSTFRRMPSMEERKGRSSDNGMIVWRDNEYGTLEEDAQRRDFTVNAIYFDPSSDDGEIIDHVGGLADLRNKIVRTVGATNVRFLEDPVRMLRACKLVGQYGFNFEESVKREIELKAGGLTECSPVRLQEEIFKILKKPFVLPIFTACFQTGVLNYLLPKLAARWQTPEGKFCRELLRVRDEQLAKGKIIPSRVTGLAVIALPFLELELRATGQEKLWIGFDGIDRYLTQWIKEFFAPYQLSRYLRTGVRDVLLLQPKLLKNPQARKVREHPEYKRGSDLLQVYKQADERT